MKLVWKVIFVAVFCSSLQLSGGEKLVIAHRGASAYLPEHTAPSVALAHGMGVDFIEPDVVLSKDGVPMVFHDIHLEGTTNVEQAFPERKRSDGSFYVIDFSKKELKSLRVFERRDKKGKGNVYPKRFPTFSEQFVALTLAEYIELVEGLNHSRNKKIGIIPEIKNPSFHLREGQDITKIVYELLVQYGYEKAEKLGQAVIQCFEDKPLLRIKNDFKSKIPLVQLIGWTDVSADGKVDWAHMLTDRGLKEVGQYAFAVSPWIGQIFEEKEGGIRPKAWLAKAQKVGLKVIGYTARDDALVKPFKSSLELHEFMFRKAHLDGLFSDHPDVSLQFLGRM